LILASTSTTRRRILQDAHIPHRAISPGVDEEAAKASMRAQGLAPRDQADALAELKARAGWARTHDLTLGCDQVLECQGEAYDKAPTLAALRAQLVRLRGQPHRLHTALVLVDQGEPTWRALVTATLHVRDFTDRFLDAYLETEGEGLLDCVGGYRIEGPGIQLFDRIEGDYFAILGLPLTGLLQALRQRRVLTP
jgi:septum formation protein